MQNGSLQSRHHHTVSLLSIFPIEFLDFCEQILLHTFAGCLLLAFRNSATKRRQMAAHSTAIFSDSFEETKPDFKP
jgi:hypothetical protein